VSRTVLVTGGAKGIGLACAERFAALGDRVAVTYNSSPPPPGFLALRCDVRSAEEVDAAFAAAEAELGPVEVVVANAGITRDQLVLRMKDDDFAAVLDTNLTGAFRVARRAAKGMLRQRAGRIVLMGSVVGLLGSAGQVNYAAAKAGLVGMARSLARELGSRGITVNVVGSRTTCWPPSPTRSARPSWPRSPSGGSCRSTRWPAPSPSWPRRRPVPSPVR
jgi:3-oxoacyl-[acyl-carrier protein] reductase